MRCLFGLCYSCWDWNLLKKWMYISLEAIFLIKIISLLCHCEKQLLWWRGGAVLNPDGVKEVKSFRVNSLYIFNIRRQRNKLSACSLFSLYSICMSCLFKCHMCQMSWLFTDLKMKKGLSHVLMTPSYAWTIRKCCFSLFSCVSLHPNMFNFSQFAVHICKFSHGSTCCWSQKSMPLLMFYLLCLFQSLKWRKNA